MKAAIALINNYSTALLTTQCIAEDNLKRNEVRGAARGINKKLVEKLIGPCEDLVIDLDLRTDEIFDESL